MQDTKTNAGSSGFTVGNAWCTEDHMSPESYENQAILGLGPGYSLRPPQWK
jgi:hypothetical protein